MKSREEYIQSLHNEIDEWNKQIDRLNARARLVEAEYRLELQKQIDSLTQQRAAIEGQVEKLSTSSAEAWEDLKNGIDSAWEKMNKAVGSAAASFLK
jgi:predicted  nucleic acid-binding Zn-ribbon protein